MASPFDLLASWPPGTVAVGVTSPAQTLTTRGPIEQSFALASVTKVLVAMACWVAVEEETLALDQPAGPTGSTVAHLLAHASGLAPDGPATVAAPVGQRRIYSNAGFELLGDTLAASAGIDTTTYLREAIVEPLGLRATALTGSPAHGATSTVADLLAVGRELLRPTLISAEFHAMATKPFLADLAGVLPGFGRQDPNPWGLGVEVRGHKSPHWTARTNSADTFGHFGRSGTFLWVDPRANLAAAVLTDIGFGPWASEAWPALSERLLGAYHDQDG